jgi:hypothetical protein
MAEKLMYIRQKCKQQELVQWDPLQDIDADEEAVQVFLGATGVRINSFGTGFLQGLGLHALVLSCKEFSKKSWSLLTWNCQSGKSHSSTKIHLQFPVLGIMFGAISS